MLRSSADARSTIASKRSDSIRNPNCTLVSLFVVSVVFAIALRCFLLLHNVKQLRLYISVKHCKANNRIVLDFFFGEIKTMYPMAKTTSINLRISPEFRSEIEALAEYHGLSMSSYAHSLLVKSVRQAKEMTPEVFPVHQPERHLAPVVATITPAIVREPTKAEVRRMINQDELAEIERRVTPRKTQSVPLLKQKAK